MPTMLTPGVHENVVTQAQHHARTHHNSQTKTILSVGSSIESAHVLSLGERKVIKDCTAALVFANIHYLLRTMKSKENTENQLRRLQINFAVLPLIEQRVDRTLNSRFADVKDARQNFSVEDQNPDRIITRNKSDNKHSDIPVSTPQESLDIYRMSG